MPLVHIAIGSNLGDRAENIRSARHGMALLPETVLLENAPLYETAPQGGPPGQDLFYNTVSIVDTTLEPVQLLAELQALEKAIGRDRSRETRRWGPRLIDLDIILWEDRCVEEPGLTIPHPRLAERRFVLQPLADLDPDLLHPVADLTIKELLERLDSNDEDVRRLSV
ncbi:MAG: 2-amino-4-hydroxy-6-hydroxymethyldihydropteridine diphosphokinase [Planctomycetes bacterium]|nr:2-amino-4-hydroxy-6-hydroxymethyldihydropteridine diphosphokinase [Planctomycetota bacterium]